MKNIATLLSVFIFITTSSYGQYPGGVSASSTNELWIDAIQQPRSDGHPMGWLLDQSGNGNRGEQYTQSRKPLYRVNGLNNMPAYEFDGVDDYSEIAANSDFNSNQMTHFVVYDRSNLVPAATNILFNMGFSEASNLIFTYAYPSDNQSYVKKSNGGTSKLSSGGIVGSNVIASFLWNGTAGTYQGYYNGNATSVQSDAFNTASGHDVGRIGAFNTNYKFRGMIAEIVYYTSVLNSAERNIIENYLSAKYQIGLALDLYGHEATHRYDAIGIGQEADGNNLTASGTSNIDLSATTMGNGEYVMIGHDNGGLVSNTSDVPSGYSRYNQVWRSTLTGYSGTVDISFDVSSAGLGSDNAYILLVDGDGVFASGATEYPGVFAAGTVTFTGVTLTSTSYLTLSNSDFAIVSTGTTNDWHLTTTWSCGCIPTLGSDVSILTGHNVFINGQNAQVGNLTIDGSLTFNSSDTLQISADLTNNNTITPGTGAFSFSGGASAQNINGAAEMYTLTLDNSSGLTINTSLTVQGWLNIKNGTLTTNNALTLLSNATGTAAYKNPGSGEISGNYTVERFLDEGESYYLLAPVVSGGTLEDWNQEFEMQGFTGTEWVGGVSSVYYFDQNNISSSYYEGYTVPTSTFDVIDPKVGYEIYVGNDSYASGSRTIDITGTPVLGDVSYSCPHLVQTGNPADDGWSLITNPYPAPLEWWTVTKSANYDAAYVKRNTGARQSINNLWTLGSGEAFWVHSNPGGTTLDFFAWAAGFDQVITDTYNLRSSNDNKVISTIKLEYTHNNNNEIDIAYLGFSENATDLKDSDIDAYKLNNIYGYKPNLSTTNDGKLMERNTLSMDNNSVVPLNIVTETPSSVMKNYTISFEDIPNLLANNKTLTLEDRELAVFTDLTHDLSYSFSMMDTVTQPRFFIHVTSPLTAIKSDVTCYGANDGKLFVDGFPGDTKNYVWKDQFNNIIATSSNILTADSLVNLIPGTYTVEVTNTISSEIAINTFNIVEPNDLISDFYTMFNSNDDVNVVSTSQNDTLMAFVNQQVDFESAAQNVSTYSWNFGDLTYSSLENPSHTYFNTGLYKVELSAGNGNCDKVSEQYIFVDNITGIEETNLLDDVIVYNNNSDIIISFNNNLLEEFTLNIYNTVGQEVISRTIQAAINHTEKVTIDNAAGVYMVSLKSGKSSKTEKIVITKE